MEIVKNKEKHGIEIYFEIKPKMEILTALKQHSFRWHNVKKCWYAKDNQENIEFANSLNVNGEKVEKVTRETIQENELGIKVGDIFYMSWGYEQTNVDFFRVKELRGKTQVVLQEVNLKLAEETGISGMSADRIYDKNNYTITTRSTVHIKDNEKGAIKKVLGTKENPYISMTSYANAYLYEGQKLYESWYG